MHISVTIPAFNHARFISSAIESVLAQDADFDVLVVDDRSSDDTFEVAERYSTDPRVRCVRNDSNLGLVRNWNRCLELAQGPLVMVFGDDDLLEPGYLAAAARIFAEHPRVGLVHAPVRTINSAGEIVSPGSARPETRYAAGDEAVASLLKGGLATVTTVVRRDCYEQLGAYDEEIRDTPDLEFAARIGARHDVYDLGSVQGSFRWHAGKWGHLSYLEPDTLEIWMRGDRRLWSHLSESGRRAMGAGAPGDFDAWIDRRGARFALDGALACIAHRRGDRARHYLRRAMQLDGAWWRRRRFWQALALLYAGGLGARFMLRRMSGGA